jgi:hypothetical protein
VLEHSSVRFGEQGDGADPASTGDVAKPDLVGKNRFAGAWFTSDQIDAGLRETAGQDLSNPGMPVGNAGERHRIS